MSQESQNDVGFFRAMISELGQRLGLSRMLGGEGGRRNMDEILRRKARLDYQDFVARYDRKDIAGRIVDAFPDATWRKAPIVVEDKEENETAFEEAWKTLETRLRCTHYFTRADKLAGLGHYSVILIGVKGGSALSTPLQPNALRQPSSIIYLSVFSEQNAKVHTWVTDPKNERFGKPNMYRINFSSNVEGFTGVGTREVHWSRVIHIAEDLLEDEVYGRPRLERGFNLLEDLEKVVGGAAEMFYQGADRGLHADIRDDFKLDADQKKEMKQQLEEYREGVNRILRTQGVDVNTIGGNSVDPKGAADILLDLLAGTYGIPKRILIGSERGELASSQDETNFLGRVKERQEDHAEPNILRAFIDRLIWLGVFTAPANGYEVEWPSLFEESDGERLNNAKSMAATNKLEPGTYSKNEIREKAGYPELEKGGDHDDDNDDDDKNGEVKTDDQDKEAGDVTRTAEDFVKEEVAQA